MTTVKLIITDIIGIVIDRHHSYRPSSSSLEESHTHSTDTCLHSACQCTHSQGHRPHWHTCHHSDTDLDTALPWKQTKVILKVRGREMKLWYLVLPSNTLRPTCQANLDRLMSQLTVFSVQQSGRDISMPWKLSATMNSRFTFIQQLRESNA